MTVFARTTFRTDDGLTLVGDAGGPEGAPLVLLMHGGGQTRHSWAKALTSLAKAGYRVVNLDARGHGESDWSAGKAYDPASRVSDIRAVIAGHDGPYALVGASMGGLTAIQGIGLGLTPAALVLVDVVPRLEKAGVQRIVGFMNSHHDGFASLEEAVDAVAAYYPERPRPKDPSGLMKNLRLKDDGRLYWHWDPAQFGIEDPRDFRKSLDEATNTLGASPGIAVMVVRGMLSDMVSQAGVDAFSAQVPQARIADIAQAGHMVAGDRNDAFNGAVVDFLRETMPVSEPAA